ncbi:hypothetical protein CYMTET_15531 [Cymbomonas tetramitiformis]|uniref:Uncharacterized protein n=1 Tax=Cymbomonas tetramitiformis TaxID=36881 RepID=A0AAE0GDU1_9CHLO|nr:hypothetical protein CYMTET_15531 [Cymbomonas tetramitiformis]
MWHITYSKLVEKWSTANPGKQITKAVFAAVFPEAWDKWQKSIRVRAVASKVGICEDGISPENIGDEFFVKSNLQEEIRKSNKVKEEMATLPPLTPEEAQIPAVGTSKRKATQVWGSVPATGLRQKLADAEEAERRRQEGLDQQEMFAACARELERLAREANPREEEDPEAEEPGQAEIFRACEAELKKIEKEAEKARREEEKAQKAAEKAAERESKKRERERLSQEKKAEMEARKRARVLRQSQTPTRTESSAAGAPLSENIVVGTATESLPDACATVPASTVAAGIALGDITNTV